MSEFSQAQPSRFADDALDLRGFVRILWAGKWLIGSLTLTAAVIAVIVALLLPDIYRAEALLAPNSDKGAGGLSALASQYGGLASLAGIKLDSESTDKTALGLEILRSRRFISDFIRNHDILVPVMAAEGWKRDTGELEIDPDIYDVSSNKWVRKAKSHQKTIPSAQEAYERFSKDILSVSQDKKTGFVTIAVNYYSPDMAKQWVDWLVQDINAAVMRQEVDQAEQVIAYLNKQIASTSLAYLQNVFYGLIEEQIKTVMLAKVSDEYLLRTIDPAVAPEKKSRPRRALIVVISALLPAVLATLLVLLLGLRESSKN